MSQNPWAPPVESNVVPAEDRYRAFALVGFYLAATLEGALVARHPEALIRIPALLAEASAATMWCIVDASSRGAYFPHSFRWLTMLTWPLAVPVYLIHSRGARGVLLALGAFVGVALAEALGGFLGRAISGSF